MRTLKDKLINEGKVLSDTVVKADSFLNHQTDPLLMKEIGEEFANRFTDEIITKILTTESSAIAPATMLGLTIGAPVVFARKRKSLTQPENSYTTNVQSFTSNEIIELTVSKDYLSDDDNVLIVDNFLADGEVVEGLLDIVEQSGATVIGVGIVIEKGFQKGGQLLRERGIQVESLVNIKSLENGTLEFFEENDQTAGVSGNKVD